MKEKCEGGVPCSRCRRLHRPCQHRLVAFTAETERDAERLALMEQIVTHFIGNVPQDNDELRKIADNLTSGRQNSVSTEAAYDPSETDGSAIAEETYTVEEISGNAAHYSGELSHWNFSRRVQREVNSLATESGSHERTSDSAHYRAKHLQSSGPTIMSVAQCFPPRPVAEFLASIFFRFGQTNYFFVEEDWFSAKLGNVYNQSLNWSSDESPTWCILLMVLAIGTQFVHLDIANTSEHPLGFNSSQDETVEDGVGVNLYKLAAKLVPDVLTIASLESVQACLLLGVYTLPLDTPGLSYTYLGVALRICIQNGLHRRKPGTLLDEYVIEVRKRLWWTVFTLEKRICILHGRPLSISSSDIDIEMPTDLPHFRPANFDNLRAIIMLTPHLEAIASTIIRLRNSPRSLQADRLNELLKHSDSLKAWWSSLPADISGQDLGAQTSLFRANVHLNLAFLVTQVFMGRPFLFTYNKPSGSPGSTKAKASPAQTTLVNDCIQASYRIIELCQLLVDNGGFARASYIELSSCRAALLVFLAHCLNENTPSLRNGLSTGLRFMRLAAHRRTDSGESDCQLIELLGRAIRRLNSQAAMETKSPHERPSGYENFRNWGQLWTQQCVDGQVQVDVVQNHPEESNTAEITELFWPHEDLGIANFGLESFFTYPNILGNSFNSDVANTFST